MALLIPMTMLTAYSTPLQLTAALPITIPGTGTTDALSFPELVVAQGTWVAMQVNDSTHEEFWNFLRSLGSQVAQALFASNANTPPWWNPFRWEAFAQSLTVTLATVFVVGLAFFLTLLGAMIGYAQIIFAQVAIAILALLGPLMIPWLLLQPMAFLFWGWLRSLLTYGFYAAVSAAIFRVMLALLAGTTERVLDEINVARVLAMEPEAAARYPAAFYWIMILIVAAVAAILSFLRIPSLASSLVTGQAAGDSMGTALAATYAAARGAAGVATAGKSAAAGGLKGLSAQT